MAAMIGQVHEFDAVKDWPQSVEWFGQFFITNDFAGEKKPPVVIGLATYKLPWSLIMLPIP